MEVVKNKIFGMAGVLVILVALFLPFVNIYLWGYKVAYTNGFVPWKGKVILALLVLVIIFIFKDYISKIIPKWYESSFGKKFSDANSKFILVPASIIALLMIILVLRLGGDSYKFAIGYYITCGGVALLVVHAFFDKSSSSNTISNNQINQQPMMNNNQMNQQPMMNNDQINQQPVMNNDNNN